MKNLPIKLVIILILLTTIACSSQSPQKAFTETNPVLVQYYIQGDVDGAFKKLDPTVQKDFTIEQFKSLRENVLSENGPIQSFTTDSYIMIPKKDAAMLFYTAVHEKGKSHHRIIVLGNEEDGYKVAGLYSQKQPYGEKYKVRKKVSKPTIVK